MCDKAVDTYLSITEYVLDGFKSQEMCDKLVSDDLFKLKYCHDRYNTQRNV